MFIKAFQFLVAPLILILIWGFLAQEAKISPILLPSPFDVMRTARALIENGELFEHIAASAKRTMLGFILSSVTGLALALVFSQSQSVKRLGFCVVEAFRVTPPLALIPLLILWLGIEEAPKVAIVFLSSFFPIYLNSLTAIESVESRLKEVAQVLHFSAWETFRYLTLPSSVPGILSGLRVGLGYSWRALVGAELIAAASGLGFMISEASEFSKTDVVFVGIFSIIVIGVLMDWLLSCLVKRCAKYFAN